MDRDGPYLGQALTTQREIEDVLILSIVLGLISAKREKKCMKSLDNIFSGPRQLFHLNSEKNIIQTNGSDEA